MSRNDAPHRFETLTRTGLSVLATRNRALMDYPCARLGAEQVSSLTADSMPEHENPHAVLRAAASSAQSSDASAVWDGDGDLLAALLADADELSHSQALFPPAGDELGSSQLHAPVISSTMEALTDEQPHADDNGARAQPPRRC
jgi:hypothetical protein